MSKINDKIWTNLLLHRVYIQTLYIHQLHYATVDSHDCFAFQRQSKAELAAFFVDEHNIFMIKIEMW